MVKSLCEPKVCQTRVQMQIAFCELRWIPIRWLLAVQFEWLLEPVKNCSIHPQTNINWVFLFTYKRLCYSRKIGHLTREFHVKFHLKKRYRTHRFTIRAISVFRAKFNVEFPCQVMNFPKVLQVHRLYILL